MAKSPTEKPIQVTQIITQPDKTTMLQVRRATLKVVKGQDKGEVCEVSHVGVTIGTAPDCELVMTDASVSRRHCEIFPADQGFVIRDLESKNGTRVSGLKVKEVLLSTGADIRVGKTVVRLAILDEHDEYPLSSKTSFGPLQGRSVGMRQVFAVLETSCRADATVLLEGESGTGKDLAAETIHQRSPRREKPFVVVDCGAMQSTLAESELFGHTKGSFTGAQRDRAGAIESANGGTVFLDEIGELDASIQPKLLRFLEKREIKRLGENRYRPVDVRLIAATNRDLKSEVQGGRFREDLYYRLSVVRVKLPPLRERREDIGPLARSFVQSLQPELDPVEVINEQVLGMFLNHNWPGNVRELRNVIERLLLFPDRPHAVFTPDDASGGSRSDLLKLPFHDARRAWTERFEKVYLSTMLDDCDGVVSRAADKANLPRQTFHRLMNKHGLKK